MNYKKILTIILFLILIGFAGFLVYKYRDSIPQNIQNEQKEYLKTPYKTIEKLEQLGKEKYDEELKKKYLIAKFITAQQSLLPQKEDLEYLENLCKKLEEEYKKILPGLLQKIISKNPESKIEVHLGLKGMKNAYSKELDFKKGSKTYLLGLMSSSNYDKKVNDYFLKSQTKSLVEKRLLSYLNNNSNHLPMYAKPDMV